MASDVSFVEFVVDQFAEDCAVTYKKMFGEVISFLSKRRHGVDARSASSR